MFSTMRTLVAGAAALVVMGCASAERATTDISTFPESSEPPAAIYRHADAGVGPAFGRHVHGPSGAVIDVASFGDLQGWAEDDHAAALRAFLVSCERFQGLRDSASIGGLDGRVSDWRAACAAAQDAPPALARSFFETWFSPLKIEPDAAGVITAYFEPELLASREPTGTFRYPIYRTPPEVERDGPSYGRRMADGRLTPFYSREEIDRGALRGRALEIAYLDDAVDLFFLHIQGSGRLNFVDGDSARVGFAAKNGWPYRSVGQAMLRRDLAPDGDASTAAIQRFYRNDPTAGRALLAANPSYIFFRELEGLDPMSGPVGAFGVQLVAGRSLAVDRAFIPLGAPVWLETDSPLGPIERLMMAHDVGSAIIGPQRGDYFWGVGDEAGRLAGQMKYPGAITVLLPNAAALRLVGGAS